ncbi:MAG: hypothetical protein AAF419_04305 [Pseudomonadota bacterium]
MSKLLADRDIAKLIGTVLLDADERYINPNGIELRLGKYVFFHSTTEELELQPDQFLEVHPGENVIISSLEQVDFSPETVAEHFPDKMLMAWITPTTTMMREGISQVSTKVDTGYEGALNWRLRNGSTKNLLLGYGEPIFKLTLELLEGDEKPDRRYGERNQDTYQGSQGIMHSTRKIPAQIPKNKKISSSIDKLDPAKQLQDAGYPFNYISTELIKLHGNLETVSKDFGLLKGELDQLSTKIEQETNTLSIKMDEGRQTLMEKVELLFSNKFYKVAGTIVGAMTVIIGCILFFLENGVNQNVLAGCVFVAGIAIIVLTQMLNNNNNNK